MPRLTITLSSEMHQALKEAALRRGRSIRQIIEESLAESGLKTTSSAASIVARARKRAGLDEARAIDLAVGETKAERRR